MRSLNVPRCTSNVTNGKLKHAVFVSFNKEYGKAKDADFKWWIKCAESLDSAEVRTLTLYKIGVDCIIDNHTEAKCVWIL